MGLEVCRQLAAAGQHVVLGSRSAAAGETAARSLAARGLDVEPHPLDVTDDESVRALAAHVERALGGADVLVNNAGLLLDEDGNVLDVDVRRFRDCMETNVYGPLRLTQAVMPGMISRGYGRVVNVSSEAGQISSMSDYAPPYSLSKAALNALTRLLASAAPGRDVLVNAVDPGWVRTDMGGRAAPRSVAQGADTIVWCATLPSGGPSGRFFHDRKEIAWWRRPPSSAQSSLSGVMGSSRIRFPVAWKTALAMARHASPALRALIDHLRAARDPSARPKRATTAPSKASRTATRPR